MKPKEKIKEIKDKIEAKKLTISMLNKSEDNSSFIQIRKEIYNLSSELKGYKQALADVRELIEKKIDNLYEFNKEDLSETHKLTIHKDQLKKEILEELK